MIYILDSTADSREQSPPSRASLRTARQLAHLIQFVYSFQIIAPVVRTERKGFEAETDLSSHVVSSRLNYANYLC